MSFVRSLRACVRVWDIRNLSASVQTISSRQIRKSWWPSPCRMLWNSLGYGSSTEFITREEVHVLKIKNPMMLRQQHVRQPASFIVDKQLTLAPNSCVIPVPFCSVSFCRQKQFPSDSKNSASHVIIFQLFAMFKMQICACPFHEGTK